MPRSYRRARQGEGRVKLRQLVTQHHGGALVSGGNPGNIGGPGGVPTGYRFYMRDIIDSKQHRDEFRRVMENADHPAFMAATKHAAAYAEGLPVQRVEVQDSPQEAESGETRFARLAAAVPLLLMLMPGDQRAQMLKQLRAKEEIVVEAKSKK